MSSSTQPYNVILHLSDLHFGWDGRDQNKIAERTIALRELLSELQSLARSWKPGIICITGDIGWRGVENDYVEARNWIERLLEALNLESEALFLCAGNHDSYRPAALSNVRPANRGDAGRVLKLPLADQYVKPFAAFSQFCRDIGVPPYRVDTFENYLVGTRAFGGINVLSLNSAWFSQGNDDKGRLWIGLPIIRQMEASNQISTSNGPHKYGPTVVLMHHPKEWLHDDEISASSVHGHPNTFDYLSVRSQLILTGHTHGEVRPADRYAERAWHLTGGAAYAGAAHFNTFRLIRLENDRLTYRSFEFDPRSSTQPWESKGTARSLSLDPPTEQAAAALPPSCKSTLSEYRQAAREHASRYVTEKARALTPRGRLPEPLVLQVVARSRSIEQQFDADGRLIRSEKIETTLPLLQAARASRRTLLLGDMGAGKSTLAGTLVCEILDQDDGVFAVLIEAKAIQFESVLTIASLVDLVSSYANKQIYPELDPVSLRGLLQSTVEVTLIVDGLDELPNNRPAQLLRRLYDLPNHWPNIQVVATGRPVELIGVSYEDWQVLYPAELNDDDREALFRYELKAQGRDEDAASQTAQAMVRKLKGMPLVYAAAVTPLAVRLLFSQLSKADVGKLVTIGELLCELAKERAGSWSAKDQKVPVAPRFEGAFSEPAARIDLLGYIAVHMGSRNTLSRDEALRVANRGIAACGVNESRGLSAEALDYFGRCGLLLIDTSISFPSQSLLEFFQGVGLATRWENGAQIDTLPNERWRIVSFAAAVLRSRGLIDSQRRHIIDYVDTLLTTSKGVLPAAYIVVEARDSSCADAYVRGLKRLPPRPLTMDWKTAASAAQALALALRESAEGFEWFYGEYLEPRLPYMHLGSGIVERIFREWAALAFNELTERQRTQLSALAKPHVAAGTGLLVDVIPVISFLVPEAFSEEERLWFNSQLLGREPFSELVTSRLAEDWHRAPDTINAFLLHHTNSLPHALLWKRLNPHAMPPPSVIKTFLSSYATSRHSRRVESCESALNNATGESLPFARWNLSDSNSMVAAGSAVYLRSKGIDVPSSLVPPLLRALHDGGYSRAAEVTLTDLIEADPESTLPFLIEEIADAASDMHGAHSGWWRLLLARIRSSGTEAADVLMRTVRGVGCFLLARYPEVRQAFRDLLTEQPSCRETLRDALHDLDPGTRHGAAMVLVVVSPDTEAVALQVVVRSRSRQSHGSWHEWEEFLLSLSFGPSSLEHLNASLPKFDSHGRILALAILMRNRIRLPYEERLDLLKGVLDWSNHHLAGAVDFEAVESLEMLGRLLYEPNLKLARGAARMLRRLPRSNVGISKLATAAVLCEEDVAFEMSSMSEWVDLIHADSAFRNAVLSETRRLREFGARTPILGIFAETPGGQVKWADVVWRTICESTLGSDTHREVWGYWLLEQARKSPETRAAIGTAAKEFMADPRVVGSRFSEARQWLTVIADECVGLTPEELEKALLHDPPPIRYSAAAALIARLERVPEGFEPRRSVGAVPETKLTRTAIHSGDEALLRELVRSSDSLHPSLCPSIDVATLKTPLTREQLDALAIEGSTGSLVAVVLSFCYGDCPSIDWVIRHIRYFDRWDLNARQDSCLRQLLHCWRDALKSANASSDFREELIEALSDALAEQNIDDIDFFSVARAVFDLRGRFTLQEAQRVVAFYSSKPGYYDHGLALPMARWLMELSDQEERRVIAHELERAITYLDEWSWRPESNRRTCYPLLIFPAVLWSVLGTSVPSDVSVRVFLRGLRHLFTVASGPRQLNERQMEMVANTSDMTFVVQQIPSSCLKRVVQLGAVADDPVIRAVAKFFYIQ